MAIAKKVLLARPHSFVVSEMRPFLEKSGFAPTKLENLQARVAVVGGGVAGVELALAIRYRLASLLEPDKAEVFLVSAPICGAIIPDSLLQPIRRSATAYTCSRLDGGSARSLYRGDIFGAYRRHLRCLRRHDQHATLPTWHADRKSIRDHRGKSRSAVRP